MTTGRIGADTPIVIGNCANFGIGVSAVAGAMAFFNSFNMDRNYNVLRSNPIGSGKLMNGIDTQVGMTDDTVTGDKDCHYNDAANKIIAQFFGTAAVNVAGSGAYTHSYIFNETSNSFFNCIAQAPTSDVVREAVSVCCRKLTFSAKGFGPITMAIDGLADQLRTTPTSNTTAGMDAATVANTKRIILKQSDYFRLNAQGGAALAVGDNLNITDIELAYDKGQEHVFEVKGAVGNGLPRLNADPPFKVTVKVTLRNRVDFTYETAVAAGTAYKAELGITGDLIGGSNYYFRKWDFPYLKLLTDPKAALSGPGENPVTLEFEALMASAAPTGMISAYPYIMDQSDRVTAWSTAD